jgi:hypothetical protein
VQEFKIAWNRESHPFQNEEIAMDPANIKSPEESGGATPEQEPKPEGPKVFEEVKIPVPELTLYERVEAFISNLSTRNTFWNRVCSLIWLPYAFHSGITMSSDDTTHRAILPFRRFNRNWYNAMAGAALLGNTEIAGGNYVFKVCGGNYTVVCKNLEYRFLRPCLGPAEYRMTPLEDIHALVATGKEFNIAIRMDVVQVLAPVGKKKPTDKNETEAIRHARAKRVGRCTATFHVTPKAQHKAKKHRGTSSK